MQFGCSSFSSLVSEVPGQIIGLILQLLFQIISTISAEPIIKAILVHLTNPKKNSSFRILRVYITYLLSSLATLLNACSSLTWLFFTILICGNSLLLQLPTS